LLYKTSPNTCPSKWWLGGISYMLVRTVCWNRLTPWFFTWETKGFLAWMALPSSFWVLRLIQTQASPNGCKFSQNYSSRQCRMMLDRHVGIVWTERYPAIAEIKANLKAVFHCSRFARAGEANMFQPLQWLSNRSVFCLLSCARPRLEVELHSASLACPDDWFFTRLKSFAPPAPKRL
jgi:hypothetical protein